MESSRLVGSSHCNEFRDGLSARANQFVVQRILQRAAKLRIGKFLASYRAIQCAGVHLHNNRCLRGVFAANVANKMAHVDDKQLFKRVDGRTNVLSAARFGGQPRPAYFGGHRAIRQHFADVDNRFSASTDDFGGIRRSFVGIERFNHNRGAYNTWLYVLVFVYLFWRRNVFCSQGWTAFNRLELRPTKI